jgi:hypothetical protein
MDGRLLCGARFVEIVVETFSALEAATADRLRTTAAADRGKGKEEKKQQREHQSTSALSSTLHGLDSIFVPVANEPLMLNRFSSRTLWFLRRDLLQ